MENPPCSSYLLFFAQALLLLAIPVLLLELKFRGKARKDRARLPPGPWRLPVIGSLHHLAKTPLVHRALADLARRHSAPVMYLRLGELHTVVISSPDAAREVLKTHDTVFATRPMILSVRVTMDDGVGLGFCPYGQRWRQLRKVCAQELLGASRVRSFRPIREDEAACLVRDIAAAACPPPGGEPVPVDVSARVVSLVADAALRAMMGERFKRRDEFMEVVPQIVKVATGLLMGDLFPSFMFLGDITGTVRKILAFHHRMFELVDCAIEQYRERKTLVAAGSTTAAATENLLGVLLSIEKEASLDCSLDMGTIKSVILDLFIAGSETTSTTINWAMVELMRTPKVMHKAQAEVRGALQGKTRVTEDDLVSLHYLKLVIKETLRLHPSGPLLVPRECRESCKIQGYDVPKGTMVLVNAWAIGRDSKYWDEPEVFKPERFEEDTTCDFHATNFKYIPFGAGRRMCPGAGFSLVTMELVLATLLFHFDWQLPPGVTPSDLDMSEEFGLTVRRKEHLYLHPTIRVPLGSTV